VLTDRHYNVSWVFFIAVDPRLVGCGAANVAQQRAFKYCRYAWMHLLHDFRPLTQRLALLSAQNSQIT
ncbi:hypothetical protein, partial [Shewanella sp.]|uniref:hypothetical protein n=1 Tax=Shewanella sp. TaxID=50422 RepID=UPI00257FBD27